MTNNPPVFNAAQYNKTTHQQRDQAAEAWHRRGFLLSRWLGPATETMMDMRDISKGSRVLDVAAMVYSSAEKNPFFSTPVSILRRRAKLTAPLSGQPGPFSLGTTKKLEDLLNQARFRNTQVQKVNAPIRLSSAEDCLQSEQELFGAPHQMLSGLPDTEQDDAWKQIEDALGEFETNGQFEGPCEMLIAVGTK
jgi:hypothetical protein